MRWGGITSKYLRFPSCTSFLSRMCCQSFIQGKCFLALSLCQCSTVGEKYTRAACGGSGLVCLHTDARRQSWVHHCGMCWAGRHAAGRYAMMSALRHATRVPTPPAGTGRFCGRLFHTFLDYYVFTIGAFLT